MKEFFNSPEALGKSELRRDPVIGKIPLDEYSELIAFAWKIGKTTAQAYREKCGLDQPTALAEKLGVVIEHDLRQIGMEGYLPYSEYYSNKKLIVLYVKAIDKEYREIREEWHAKVGGEKGFRELFVAHELFHHIECWDIGLVSKRKTVTTLKLGPFRLTSGIRALSEIGAHAFARTFLGWGESFNESV